jgi:hypothetical protein
MTQLGGGRRPGASFLKKVTTIFRTPIRIAIAPLEEENLERITGKGTKIGQKETNQFGGDNKYKSTITELGNTKLLCNATNGGLQEGANRLHRKTKLTAAKSSHKVKRGAIEYRVSNMNT